MKKFETKDLRNIALIGHGKSGKTSLAEAILFDTGVAKRLGSVNEGTSLMDYEPEEIKRKTTTSSSFHNIIWNKTKINIVDTPGDNNFISDTFNSLQVVEGAILLIDATSGVEVGTEKCWNQTKTMNLPVMLFISKMDRERADFFKIFDEIKEILKITPIPLQIPIGKEADFKGIIDLLKMKALIFNNEKNGKFNEKDISEELKENSEKYKEKLIESIAEHDDILLEKYLEGEKITQDEIFQCLKKGIQNRSLIPVVCGSPINNIGIQPLLDIISQSFPSPLEGDGINGKDPKTKKETKRKPIEEEPFSALVFKTVADPYAGKLNIFRVYSGSLSSDTIIYNSTKDIKERVGQIFQLEGKNQEVISPAIPGDIVAVAKLKETITGDSLSDEKNPFIIEPIKPPDPIISFAIEPKSKGDEDKIGTSLSRLMEEDPTIKYHRDEQTREILLSGMGQIHIEVIVEKLKRKFGVDVSLKTPKVPYKETIKSLAKAQGKYKRQSGGRGQYGDAWLEIEPQPRSEGFKFVNKIVGGVIPRQYIPAVEKGVIEVINEGILAGYPLVDLKVTLYDGSFHQVDSSDMAFKIAGSLGFKKAFLDARPVLLEPITNMEIIAPEECLGDIIGDINSKRGKVSGMENKGNRQLIKVQVPLAEVLDYAPQLTSITSGRGDFSMEFSHYEEVPAHLSEKIISEAKAEKEEKGK
jgi:elongation factor G